MPLCFIRGIYFKLKEEGNLHVLFLVNGGESMVTRRMDIRKGGFNPIPISYLIQTANQFDCDIFVNGLLVKVLLQYFPEDCRWTLCETG